MVRNARRARASLRKHPDASLLGVGVLSVLVQGAVTEPLPGTSFVEPHPASVEQPAQEARGTEPQPGAPRVLLGEGARHDAPVVERTDNAPDAPAAQPEREPPERAPQFERTPNVERAPAVERSPQVERAAEYLAEPHNGTVPAPLGGSSLPAPSEPNQAASPSPSQGAVSLALPRVIDPSTRVFPPVEHPGGPVGPDGRVATFTIESKAEGSVFLSSSFEVRAQNWYPDGLENCQLESVLSNTTDFAECAPGESCHLAGYQESTLRGSLPTQDSAAGPLRAWQTTSRVLPIHPGTNTYYLLGRSNCRQAVWGALTLRALLVP